MKTIPVVLAFALAVAPCAHAQSPQQPSAAEQQFRDAWWAESGTNDLDAALRGYLAAAAADGPAAVRAKALVHAGRVQQRLGKTDAALATLRRVLGEFAAEREAVDGARVHLRELTAVDLRQQYDEWYERRLFGEEVQSLIVAKLETLAGKLAEQPTKERQHDVLQREQAAVLAEVMAFGKGAVPALRKAATGTNERLRDHAIEALFTLGETPPFAALLATQDWLGSTASWVVLLAAERRGDAGTAGAERTLQGRLLAGALQGPRQLIEALLRSTEPMLAEAQAPAAIASAVLRVEGGKEVVLAALAAPETPLRLRAGLERALTWNEVPVPLTAPEWLAVAADPMHFETRVTAIGQATAQLRVQDGELLDEVLGRIESAPPGSARNELANAFGRGLENALAPELLPWSVSRLRRALVIARASSNSFAPALQTLRRGATTRALLAEAILGDPPPFLRALDAQPEPSSTLGDHLSPDLGDERDTFLLCTRWHAALLAVLQTEWEKWNEAQRLAALALLQQVVHDSGDRAPLRAFIAQQKGAAGISDALRTAIEQFAGDGS